MRSYYNGMDSLDNPVINYLVSEHGFCHLKGFGEKTLPDSYRVLFMVECIKKFSENIINQVRKAINLSLYPIYVEITDVIDSCAHYMKEHGVNNAGYIYEFVTVFFSIVMQLQGLSFFDVSPVYKGSHIYFELTPW